jgi:polyisoprenyl-teichoic acid--peptidoglycan teichoic acid transferase
MAKKAVEKSPEIPTLPSRKRHLWLWFAGIILLILIVSGLYGYFRLQKWLEPRAGRTNLVVLGVGGGDHEGADLTDTMMFVSVDHPTGKAVTVSIPRDLWLDPWKTKINSIYHYQNQIGVKTEVGKILGQPVDYYVLLDFSSLVKVIDALGGVAVNVQHTFDDYQYPIAGKENDLCNGDKDFKCRYEHIHFDSGMQVMNGDTALKYIRSRHAEGDEGTDFAREARQQQLISALRTKIFSPYWLLHPYQARGVFDTVAAAVQTDYPQSDYPEMFKVFWRAWRTKAQVTNLPISEDLLLNPKPEKKYDNQWVLIFKPGSEAILQASLSAVLQ